MTDFSFEWRANISDILTSIAILATIVIAWLNLRSTKKLTVAQNRPLLGISTKRADKFVTVRLLNVGQGPAIITKLECQRGGRTNEDITQLLSINETCCTKWIPKGSKKYLGVPGDMPIVQVDYKDLAGSGKISREKIEGDLKKFINELREVKIVVKYEDVYETRYNLEERLIEYLD